MLKGIDIWKSYDSLAVLKGVDLEIEQATITSIIGKSGAGKSTLLHILGTLDVPDRGSLELGGQKVHEMTKKQLATFRNEKIGFVFQFHHLLPEFTALENVCIPAYIKGTNKNDAEAKGKELLDYLGLSARLKHKPNELSGGEQQRVAIARALINEPLVIFADEPTGNLDTQTSSELHNLFLKLRNDLSHTFVIVTHNTELADLSDRCLVMSDGKIID